MHYLIYKITNTINNMIYIGAHATNNINDYYFGSGKYLRRAIKKYGRKNFVKEILFECNSEQEMYQKEAEIVNDQFIKRKDTYNLTCGGYGGNMYGTYHEYILSVFDFFIKHNYDFELTKQKTGYPYNWKIFIKSCRRICPDRVNDIKNKLPNKIKKNKEKTIWMTNNIRMVQANQNTKQYFEKFGFTAGKIKSKNPTEYECQSDKLFLINLEKDLKIIINDIIKNGYKVLKKYLYIPYTGSPTNFVHACQRFNIPFSSQQGKIRTGKRKTNNVHHIIEVSQKIKHGEITDEPRNSTVQACQNVL